MYLWCHIRYNSEVQYRANSCLLQSGIFPLAQTKNKTKTVEFNTKKYSMQNKDTVLNLNGLDTVHNSK